MKTGIIYIISILTSFFLNLASINNADIGFYGLFLLGVILTVYLHNKIPSRMLMFALITLGILYKITRHAIDFWWNYNIIIDGKEFTPSVKLFSDIIIIGTLNLLVFITYFIARIRVKEGNKLNDKTPTFSRFSRMELSSLILGYILVIVALPVAFFQDYFNLSFPFLSICLLICLAGLFTGLASYLKNRSKPFYNYLGLIINSYIFILVFFLRIS